jgi:VanZ family protein
MPAMESIEQVTTAAGFIRRPSPRPIIGALALLTLIGILVAGLWPFHAPKNQVQWLTNENGLVFGHHGTVLGRGIFDGIGSDGQSCSVEIWLEPARLWTTGTVIAFYDPATSRQTSLQQIYTDLLLQRDFEGRRDQEVTSGFAVANVFRKKEALVTVTSNGQDTDVYINGRMVTRSQGFGFTLKDLTGQLIVADSPLKSHSWEGKVRGLAIYDRGLTAAQVSQHYEDWRQAGGSPKVLADEHALALYRFDERTGSVMHNQGSGGVDLYIPERYLVVNQIRFESAQDEYRTQRSYLKNALLNIVAFIPLGFFVYAYLRLGPGVSGAAFITVALGLSVSLTIEVLQAYLPTRYSGVTDLITNTLGTSIGVLSFSAVASSVMQRVERGSSW